MDAIQTARRDFRFRFAGRAAPGGRTRVTRVCAGLWKKRKGGGSCHGPEQVADRRLGLLQVLARLPGIFRFNSNPRYRR